MISFVSNEAYNAQINHVFKLHNKGKTDKKIAEIFMHNKAINSKKDAIEWPESDIKEIRDNYQIKYNVLMKNKIEKEKEKEKEKITRIKRQAEKQKIDSNTLKEHNKIHLEGSDTPDILLNNGEEILMDVSQGFRDLGLSGLIFRHKGRLIVTNQRAIYFKKKTKDYEIEQLNMHHAGYVKVGYNIDAKQLVFGLMLLFLSLGVFAQSIIFGLILLVLGLVVMFTARVQGLVLSGSGDKITFASKSIPASELTKIITIVSANS